MADHARHVEKMRNSTANQSEGRHLPIKVECGSVVNDPGLDTHGEKDMLAPMHIPQGIMTHHSDGVRKGIRAAEAGNSWLKFVDTVQAEAEALIESIKAEDHNSDHRMMITYEKMLEQAQARLTTATNAHDEDGIDDANADIADVMQRMDAYNTAKQYSQRVRKLNGAKQLLEAIKKYKNKTSKRPRGPAEYRYNKSFEEKAKVRFRPEHSGFELSNSDGIIALQHWNKICKATTAVYDVDSDNEDEARMAEAIQNIMDESKKVSRPLFWLSKFLKRQDKKTAKIVYTEFDPVMIAFSRAWREVYKTFAEEEDSRGVFNKLHHLEYHVRGFMLRNGFYGRGSEEGKEQAHNEFASDQQIVSRMNCPVKKTETFMRRQNSAVSPELVPMLQSMKGKKRGRYNTTGNRRQRRRIETVSNNSVRDLADGWVEVDHQKMNTSYLIKSSWKDVYMMCMYGKVPDAWKVQ